MLFAAGMLLPFASQAALVALGLLPDEPGGWAMVSGVASTRRPDRPVPRDPRQQMNGAVG